MSPKVRAIIATADRLARQMGLRFVVDPAKLAEYMRREKSR